MVMSMQNLSKYEEEAIVHFAMGNSKEARMLRNNIDEYIRLTGLSRKQVYLRGIAMYIGANGDNSNLVVQIANYLSGVGSRMGRRPSPKKVI